jgi:hypothetical protein
VAWIFENVAWTKLKTIKFSGTEDVPVQLNPKCNSEKLLSILQEVRIQFTFCKNLSRTSPTALPTANEPSPRLQRRSSEQTSMLSAQALTSPVSFDWPRNFTNFSIHSLNNLLFYRSCQHPNLLRDKGWSNYMLRVRALSTFKSTKSAIHSC